MLSWQIGDVKVTRIVEIEAIGGTRFILPQATPETILPIAWLQPHFADERGKLKMSIHALVVETPTRKILVDTCIGNDKDRNIPAWSNLQTTFLQDLAAAGYPPETIDTVLCTHLHVDHVGWNTRLVDGAWVPTFPRARYLMGRTEFDYWKDGGGESMGTDHRIFQDSVKPVFDAGLVDLVDTDHVVCEEVRLTPTLGHTPGHVSVRISSNGEQALITGDFTHHPCQLAHPEWASAADYDAQASTATRERMFTEMADSRVLVIGTHYSPPTAGYVKRDGKVFRLEV
jgi:glyoxylase-like metal-dependent hydrolase (beta-lactamase superfamily II)